MKSMICFKCGASADIGVVFPDDHEVSACGDHAPVPVKGETLFDAWMRWRYGAEPSVCCVSLCGRESGFSYLDVPYCKEHFYYTFDRYDNEGEDDDEQ